MLKRALFAAVVTALLPVAASADTTWTKISGDSASNSTDRVGQRSPSAAKPHAAGRFGALEGGYLR